MLRYSITEKRAQNLELYRASNGPYESLEDLLQVKGINNKCLYNFYKSIIHGKKISDTKRRDLILTRDNDIGNTSSVQGRKLPILNILNENYNVFYIYDIDNLFIYFLFVYNVRCKL